jgi:hypothetical protein
VPRLECFNPQRPRARVPGGLMALPGSHLPPRAFHRVVLPCVHIWRRDRRRKLARRADRLAVLLVGDSGSPEVRRQSEWRAR